MAKIRRTMLLVDASLFQKDVSDLVSAGETLGYLKGELIAAPFDARIQSISFDADDHTLRVVLEEIPRESERKPEI